MDEFNELGQWANLNLEHAESPEDLLQAVIHKLGHGSWMATMELGLTDLG